MNALYSFFNRFPKEKKTKIVAVAIILCFVCILFTRDIIRQYLIQKKGVYLLAKISDIRTSKSGPHYYLRYSFLGKIYQNGFQLGFSYKKNIGDYLFIKVLSSNPNAFKRLNYDVPVCLQSDAFMDTTFDELDKSIDNLCK